MPKHNWAFKCPMKSKKVSNNSVFIRLVLSIVFCYLRAVQNIPKPNTQQLLKSSNFSYEIVIKDTIFFETLCLPGAIFQTFNSISSAKILSYICYTKPLK